MYYIVKFLDRSAIFARDAPLLTQLDGIGMLELDELERREIIERHKEDLIRQMASDVGVSARIVESS